MALTWYVSSPGPKAAPQLDLTGSQPLDFFFSGLLWRWTFRAKIIKINSLFIKLRNVRLKAFLNSSDKTQASCKLGFSRKKDLGREDKGDVSRPQSFQTNHPICNCKIKAGNLDICLCSSLTKGSIISKCGRGNKKGDPPPQTPGQIQLECYHKDMSFP